MNNSIDFVISNNRLGAVLPSIGCLSRVMHGRISLSNATNPAGFIPKWTLLF